MKKIDSITAKCLDFLASRPTKYRLKYPKHLTPKQKRFIRKAFNAIQEDFTRQVMASIRS